MHEFKEAERKPPQIPVNPKFRLRLSHHAPRFSIDKERLIWLPFLGTFLLPPSMPQSATNPLHEVAPAPPRRPCCWSRQPPRNRPCSPGFPSRRWIVRSNPGTDFYRYANGAWLKKTTIPEDQVTWSPTTEITERNLLVLRELLEAAAPSAPGTNPHGATGWRLSMQQQWIRSAWRNSALRRLAADLAKIDALTSKAELPAMVADFHERGIGGLFSDSVFARLAQERRLCLRGRSRRAGTAGSRLLLRRGNLQSSGPRIGAHHAKSWNAPGDAAGAGSQGGRRRCWRSRRRWPRGAASSRTHRPDRELPQADAGGVAKADAVL